MLRKRADKDQLTTELTFNKNVLLQLMSSINRMMFDLKAEMTKTEFMIFFFFAGFSQLKTSFGAGNGMPGKRNI